MPNTEKPLIDSLTRRNFMQLAVRQVMCASAVLAFTPSLVEASALSSEDTHTVLTALARDLFPHDEFPKDVYASVAESIVQAISTSPKIEKLVMEGMERVSALTEEKLWRNMSTDDRVEILEKLQTDPLFNYVRTQAIDVIYNNPEVWKLIGYGGSSIEHGGYLHRGFDDISWLPQVR